MKLISSILRFLDSTLFMIIFLIAIGASVLWAASVSYAQSKESFTLNLSQSDEPLTFGRYFEPTYKTVEDYLLKISNDPKFVCTAKAENGLLTYKRKHNKSYLLCWNWQAWEEKDPPNQLYAMSKCENDTEGWFWRKHNDFGFGVSDGYYKKIVDDPRFFTDWRWNVDQTYKLYKGGTRFFGEDKCQNIS